MQGKWAIEIVRGFVRLCDLKQILVVNFKKACGHDGNGNGNGRMLSRKELKSYVSIGSGEEERLMLPF